MPPLSLRSREGRRVSIKPTRAFRHGNHDSECIYSQHRYTLIPDNTKRNISTMSATHQFVLWAPYSTAPDMLERWNATHAAHIANLKPHVATGAISTYPHLLFASRTRTNNCGARTQSPAVPSSARARTSLRRMRRKRSSARC